MAGGGGPGVAEVELHGWDVDQVGTLLWERVGASRPVGPTAAHKAKDNGAEGQGREKGRSPALRGLAGPGRIRKGRTGGWVPREPYG